MGVEILDNGTRVLTAPGATFGTDALLLARFAQPRRNERARARFRVVSSDGGNDAT